MNMEIRLTKDITPDGADYRIVSDVIALLTEDYQAQPSLDQIARRIGHDPTELQKTFTRWAGLSPKAFLQAVTIDHAKRLLREENLPLLEASYELGLSSPGRLHDLSLPCLRHRRVDGDLEPSTQPLHELGRGGRGVDVVLEGVDLAADAVRDLLEHAHEAAREAVLLEDAGELSDEPAGHRTPYMTMCRTGNQRASGSSGM